MKFFSVIWLNQNIFNILGNTTFPPGCTISCCLYNAHMDSKHFPEPEKFIPERHLIRRNTLNKDVYNVTPFAPGVRSCIGKRLYVIFIYE